MPSGQLSSFNGILIKYKVYDKKYPTTYNNDFWINNTKQKETKFRKLKVAQEAKTMLVPDK